MTDTDCAMAAAGKLPPKIFKVIDPVSPLAVDHPVDTIDLSKISLVSIGGSSLALPTVTTSAKNQQVSRVQGSSPGGQLPFSQTYLHCT